MSITDLNFSAGENSNPPAHGEIVVPDDSANFTTRTRYIYVGGDGDIALVMAGDQGDAVVVLKAVPIGTIIPVRAIRINATNTTATLMIAFW